MINTSDTWKGMLSAVAIAGLSLSMYRMANGYWKPFCVSCTAGMIAPCSSLHAFEKKYHRSPVSLRVSSFTPLEELSYQLAQHEHSVDLRSIAPVIATNCTYLRGYLYNAITGLWISRIHVYHLRSLNRKSRRSPCIKPIYNHP